jgi:hypothetical protein
MHMTLQSILVRISILCLGLLGCITAQISYAQASSVTLTVNNGATANIISGQSVLLEWEAVGVANCVINNGVGPIPNEELPTGSRVVTPENNVSYTMVCDGGADSVLVGINPIVTLSVSPNPVTTNLNGEAAVTVSWTSEYATECGRLSYVTDSGQTVWLNLSNPSRIPDYGKTSGSQNYGNSPNGPLRESATFRLTCRNVVTGASTQAEAYLEVRQRETIGVPTASIFSNEDAVSPDNNLGFGRAQITLTTTNTTRCSRRAFDMQGNPITVLGWTDRPTSRLSHTDTVNISTTTQFSAYCSRLIDGQGTTSNSILISLEGDGPILADRTLTLTAPDSLEITNLVQGTVPGTVSYEARPTANRCTFRAFDQVGSEITVPGWTGRSSGSLSASNLTLTFSTTTRLVLSCIRDYDNSWETRNATVTVTRVDGDAYFEPTLRLSGYWHTIEAEDFANFDNFEVGNSAVYSNGQALRPDDDDSLSRADTPFTGQAGTYDIYVQYCDERNSEAIMALTVDGQGFDSWRSDREVTRQDCNASTLQTKRVATGVNINPGDSIELECETVRGAGVSNARPCRIDFVRFVDTAYEVMVPVDPVTGLVSQQIVWQGENVTRCDIREATTISGVTYQFSSNNTTAWTESLNNISTTTTFRVVCQRSGDSEEAEGQFTVVPVAPQQVTALEQTAEVFVGDCIDSNQIIQNSGGGTVKPIPPGFAADENGICISNPADLYISNFGNSSMTTWVPNPDSGAYDNVELRAIFGNLGPGGFLSSVPYRFDIQLNASDEDNFTPTPGLTWIEDYPTPPTPPSYMEPGAVSSFLRVVSDLPFGSHLVRVRVNLDPDWVIYEGGTSEVYENNTVYYPLFVPAPPIEMPLTASQAAVRRGQSVTISWSVSSGYPIECVLLGADLNEVISVSPADGEVVTIADSRSTASLNNTTEFTLTCTEPTTNTVFVTTERVEVVPEVREI